LKKIHEGSIYRQTITMAKRDYEKEMADAAEQDDFKTWQALYRARNAAQPGSYINGQPASQVVGSGAPVEMAAPQTAPANPSKVAALAQQLGIQADQANKSFDDEGKDRYNQFLMSKGINPGAIGNGMVDDQGVLHQPTLDQVQSAQDLVNARSGLHSRYTQLASQSRNPVFAQQMLDQRDYTLPNTGTRDAQSNLRYWLNRLRSSQQIASSNGFAG
jgi:hypothetical protein